MRILFCLPAVTPWWLQEIIVPMLRTLSFARSQSEAAPKRRAA